MTRAATAVATSQTDAAAGPLAPGELAARAAGPAAQAAGSGALAALADAGLEVPVLGGGVVRHVNLDVAASAPALAAVAAHVTRVLPYYSSVHRGSGYPSQAITALVDG
ncbi:MAG TPA: hypothetical protein VFM66_02180, partial [Agromyces sp.]|nr:hypothetical protein [Agromyces sp.]